MLDLSGIYGEIPKALDFAVTYTLEGLKKAAEVTPDLPGPEMGLYFKAIDYLKEKAKESQNNINAPILGKNVTPAPGIK